MAEEKEYQQIIRRGIAEGLSWGVEVIAGGSGGVLLHEAFGDAERDPHRPLTKDSLFDVASVTKAVATATACALCVDDGLLDPDAPARAYLPALHPAAGGLRIRDLATHTSGYDNAKPYHRGWPSGKAFARAVQETRPVRAPGEVFEYACINFLLLGFVVEAVAGEPLDRFCTRRLFAPLGMAETRFGPVRERRRLTGSVRSVGSAGSQAAPHSPDCPYAPHFPLVKMLSAGLGEISDEGARAAQMPVGNAGLFSTASDLARYCALLLRGGATDGGQILSRRSVALMLTRLTPEGLRPRTFGWDMGDDLRPQGFSPATIYHTGWTGQSVYLDPAQDLFVVVLTNRMGDHHRAMEVRGEIAAAVARHVDEVEIRQETAPDCENAL